jgi:hypothetical protein
MYIKTEITDLADFEAWSDAKNTKNAILEADLGEEFMEALEEQYPEGITDTELNDLLWFEETRCYELVGLNDHGVKPLSASDIFLESNSVMYAIEEKIEEYNEEHGTDYNESDFCSVCESDFEQALDDWLYSNQRDNTDHDYLACCWLNDEGYSLIEEYLEENAPEPEEEEEDEVQS